MTKERDATILRSLITCFAEQGCFETKLDQVMDEVGIGKGTLYRHYGSKKLLFGAALQSGIQALMLQCQGIWDTHAADPDAGLRAVIGELLSLNHRGDPVSPGVLGRLGCGCKWSSSNHSDDQNVEAALVPLAQRWQVAGLFDGTVDPYWIVAVTIALVNSSAAAREPLGVAAMVNHIVRLLGRAFAPAPPSLDRGMQTVNTEDSAA